MILASKILSTFLAVYITMIGMGLAAKFHKAESEGERNSYGPALLLITILDIIALSIFIQKSAEWLFK